MKLDDWSSGAGKNLLKIEDGKSVVGNFRGEVVRFWQHWKGGRSIICPGRATCTMCNSPDEEDRKATGRFRVNFVTRENGEGSPLTAMIFEGGRKVYEQMMQINQDVPLEKAWVRISRKGKNQQTTWTLTVLPGDAGMLKPAHEKQVIQVPLHDLSPNKPEAEEDEPGAEG